MYNPVVMFLLGTASGVGIALFGLFTLWLYRRHRENAQLWRYPGFEPTLEDGMDDRWMAWAGFCCAGCILIAIVGVVESTSGFPHMEWAGGVLVGVGVPLGLYWLWRRRGNRTKPA